MLNCLLTPWQPDRLAFLLLNQDKPLRQRLQHWSLLKNPRTIMPCTTSRLFRHLFLLSRFLLGVSAARMGSCGCNNICYTSTHLEWVHWEHCECIVLLEAHKTGKNFDCSAPSGYSGKCRRSKNVFDTYSMLRNKEFVLSAPKWSPVLYTTAKETDW